MNWWTKNSSTSTTMVTEEQKESTNTSTYTDAGKHCAVCRLHSFKRWIIRQTTTTMTITLEIIKAIPTKNWTREKKNGIKMVEQFSGLFLVCRRFQFGWIHLCACIVAGFFPLRECHINKTIRSSVRPYVSYILILHGKMHFKNAHYTYLLM